MILIGFVFFLCLLFVSSFKMPPGKASLSFTHKNISRVLKKKNTWIFLLCAFLMQASHGTFYGFYSIYMEELGIPKAGIGLQWGVSAGSEFMIFYFASKILQSVPHRKIFSFCLFAAAIRWILTGATSSFLALTIIQTLHAFSFGAFHIVSMRLVHEIFPEGHRSFGQAFYSSFTTGFGSVAGILLNGLLWQKWGGSSFYISGALAVTALGLSMFWKNEMITVEAAEGPKPFFPDLAEKQSE